MSLRNISMLICILLFLGCDSEPAKKASAKADPYPLIPSVADKDLNITILIDLSDRIDSKKDARQPVQADRDISVVNVITSAIRKNVAAHGSFKSKARLNVYFHPEPADRGIRDIAKNLSATWVGSNDMATAKQNKSTYQSLDRNFSKGLQDIYSLAQASGYYPGSDIWRFMKDEAKLKCIEPDSSYRNILVILTDGYMYYENGKQQQPGSNRYNYIERGTRHFAQFRDPQRLSTEFDAADFGLIPATSGLKDLEVLVLECRPEESWPQDFDIMQKYWCKWFREMGVGHAEIYKSQQPAYHEKIIAGFLKKNSGVCQ